MDVPFSFVSVTDREMGEQVRRGAQVIEKYGWTQGKFGAEDTGFCLIGSLLHADGHVPVKTMETLSKFLPTAELTTSNGIQVSVHSAPVWNDDPSRTKEEVLQYMHKFADELAPLPPDELED